MAGVVSASEEDYYHELIVEDETAIGMIGGGAIIGSVSLDVLLVGAPEVIIPIAIGGVVLGAALLVSGLTKSALAGFVQQRVSGYEVIKE